MNSEDLWFAIELLVSWLYMVAALLFLPDYPLVTFILIVALCVWLVLWKGFTSIDKE